MSASWHLATSVRVINPSKQSRSTVSQVSIAPLIASSCCLVALGWAWTATVSSGWSHQ
jgi:hypothetical protein